MSTLKLWSFLSALLLHSFEFVTAFYCEFGICDTNTEYCCGDNKCCEKSNPASAWYWASGVFLVLSTIIVTAWLYMRKLKNTHYSLYGYKRLQTDPNSILQT